VSVFDLIDDLGEEEESLTETKFVSPVFHTDIVATWVKGFVHKLKIPFTDPGWYRIHPIDMFNAEIVGEADFIQREQYLKKLPKVRIILISKQKDFHIGIPLKNNAHGLSIENTIPVFLVDDIPSLFDTVICGFDGSSFWYNDIDIKNDPAKCDFMRNSFENGADPTKSRFKA